MNESKKRKRKNNNSGWSWFERVKGIPMGDETVPLSTFNNSVDFGALTADGGNIVSAESGGVGMSVGEALDELNALDEDINILLVRFYKDVLEKYIETQDILRKLQKEKYALKNSGNQPSNSLIGSIKRQKEKLRDLERKVDYHVDMDNLLKIARTMNERDISRPLSQEDNNRVLEYLLGLNKKAKTPKVGQKFKYKSYVPSIFVVEKVDDNFVYYSVEGRDVERTYPLDQFIKDKEDGTIRYVD